ncbi:TPA: acyltransferase family protein, partial [Citrobacter freundii]
MLKFRKDIGGLRAIAVLAVVLYHFSVPGFSGGFSGVDIFFVISGYLMTGIIFSKVSSGNFSLLGFYLDRA